MRQGRQRAYLIVGIFLAILMVVTTFLPAIAPHVYDPIQQDPLEPTDQPIPTFPPPVTDFSGISFENEYLHPSALYTVGQPTGWEIESAPVTGQARTVFYNADALTRVEAYLETPSTPIDSAQALSDLLTQASLEASWRGSYTAPTETARRIEGDRVIVDFELEQAQATYLARQVAWYDDSYIYVTRVAAPANARDLLVYLLDGIIPTLEPVEIFAGTPTFWTAFTDTIDGHIIRYPNNWQIVDGAAGARVTIQGTVDEVLVLDAVSGTTVASEENARAFVEASRPGAEIVSVQPVERNGVSGFNVAYTTTTLDGEGESGLVTLLNGSELLHVADLRVRAAGIDFNDAEAAATAPVNAAEILATFNLTETLSLPVETPEATAEPAPAEALPAATAAPIEAATDEPAADETEEAAATEETEEAADTDEAEADATEESAVETEEAAEEA